MMVFNYSGVIRTRLISNILCVCTTIARRWFRMGYPASPSTILRSCNQISQSFELLCSFIIKKPYLWCQNIHASTCIRRDDYIIGMTLHYAAKLFFSPSPFSLHHILYPPLIAVKLLHLSQIIIATNIQVYFPMIQKNQTLYTRSEDVGETRITPEIVDEVKGTLSR